MHLNWQQIPAHQRRMSGFLLAAVVLHSLVLLGLHAGGYDVQPELPDWMNIRLVAGIDESVYKDMPVKPQRAQAKPKPLKRINTANEQAENEISEAEQQAEAQHFVEADSRPYEHENPKPFYPAAARRRGMQGQVLLRVEVNVRGKVSNIELKKSSGYRLLDDAAITTVKQWRFIPAKNHNKLVTSVVEIPVRFELKQF